VSDCPFDILSAGSSGSARRLLVVSGLTGCVVNAQAADVWAQVFLVWFIIGYVMPFFGVELLDMARRVADFNLPAWVAQLFGVGL
jgi:hypothetical protein